MRKTILIECPDCGLRMEVDVETSKIINKYKKPVVENSNDPLKEMIDKAKKEKAEFDKYFNDARKEIDKKKEELEKHFEDTKKKAKDDKERPINPMDLD